MSQSGKPARADTALSDEAIDWLVRLNSGRATAADRTAFMAWRQRSDAHELAAREAETVWHGVGMAGDGMRRTEQRKAARTKLTRRAVLGGAVAAAAFTGVRFTNPGLFADHATGTGVRETVRLPDGSTALLNAASALDLDYTAGLRRVVLVEGQATFAVAPDPASPFVVDAGSGRTRALGAVFDVDIRPGGVAVIVLEGTVGVATDAAPGETVTAAADQRIRYGFGGRAERAEPVDADSETAWRRGKLVFNRRPLADVVADIERYRGGRIVIASGDLRGLEVTGVFDLSDPDAILAAIGETLPVEVTRLPYLAVLRSRA